MSSSKYNIMPKHQIINLQVPKANNRIDRLRNLEKKKISLLFLCTLFIPYYCKWPYQWLNCHTAIPSRNCFGELNPLRRSLLKLTALPVITDKINVVINTSNAIVDNYPKTIWQAIFNPVWQKKLYLSVSVQLTMKWALPSPPQWYFFYTTFSCHFNKTNITNSKWNWAWPV